MVIEMFGINAKAIVGRTRYVFWLIYITSFFAINLWADEYYRPNPQTRQNGLNQERLGSCMAAAEVTALESVFGTKGYDVRLSYLYRHSAIWSHAPIDLYEDEKPYHRLNLQEEDRVFIKKAGGFLPDYMWPEVGDGFDHRNSGQIPRVKQIISYHPEFPSVETMGYQRRQIFWKNITDPLAKLASIKEEIKKDRALVISIHAEFIIPLFNLRTGLLSKRGSLARDFAISSTYDSDEFFNYLKTLKENPRPYHSIAVVGFDDNLYSDYGYRYPGAIIVRNSWNYPEYVIDSISRMFLRPQEVESLRVFRDKIPLSKPAPGYYAIPYQYLVDLMSLDLGGEVSLDLDYQKFFEEYNKFKNYYEIQILPFVCEKVTQGKLGSWNARDLVQDFSNLVTKANYQSYNEQDFEKNPSLFELRDILDGEAASRFEVQPLGAPVFDYAVLSDLPSFDILRSHDFYGGQYNGYYCSSPAEEQGQLGKGIWPYLEHVVNGLYPTIQQLSRNPHSRQNWFKFFEFLSTNNAQNQFESELGNVQFTISN